jgi:DNA repair protein RadC
LKPYEKFLKHGAAYLTDAELLAIIIRTGTRNASALAIAQQILDRFEQNRQLNSLHHITMQELMEIDGIGEVKAVKIKCIAELSARMAKQHAAQTLDFKTPSSIADYYMEQLRHEEVEKVLLLLLDTKLHLMEEYLLSKGTVSASLLSTREVFRHALRAGACKIVLLHNHPSGSCNPSMEDLSVTKKIMEAGKLMEIPLLDHLIVGDGCYLSLKEHGYI